MSKPPTALETALWRAMTGLGVVLLLLAYAGQGGGWLLLKGAP
jgi:hypothetical protein